MKYLELNSLNGTSASLAVCFLLEGLQPIYTDFWLDMVET